MKFQGSFGMECSRLASWDMSTACQFIIPQAYIRLYQVWSGNTKHTRWGVITLTQLNNIGLCLDFFILEILTNFVNK